MFSDFEIMSIADPPHTMILVSAQEQDWES